MMGTRFLNFYVRSGGGSLLTKDLKANLTSKLAQDGIKYWVKMYKEFSPKDSLNFNVLQQATLFYQGKTAFDFNSGFHVGGIQANSPQLIDAIDAYPIPKVKESDKDYGIETSNIPSKELVMIQPIKIMTSARNSNMQKKLLQKQRKKVQLLDMKMVQVFKLEC
ncbi:Maltose-binding periplasmic proteins/domains [Klebsiella pneumoniae]|nr:Maltose-binding periplasmic proteins/domains [Klebsiella pneumoniae]